MYQKNFYKKPKTLRGYIKDYTVEEEIVKNDYVGQKDYFHHKLTIEAADGTEEQFLLRQMESTKKVEEGTYVSFQFKPDDEAKKLGLKNIIVSKSLGKAMSPEELAAYNQHIQTGGNTSPEKEAPKKPENKRTGFRRN